MEDPSLLWRGSGRPHTLVIDEIHRLNNPSELLKIAADRHPDTRIVATGSSTLGASAKFRDTLTGRKVELWLTPMTSSGVVDFRQTNLSHRLLHGDCRHFFSEGIPEQGFQ